MSFKHRYHGEKIVNVQSTVHIYNGELPGKCVQRIKYILIENSTGINRKVETKINNII